MTNSANQKECPNLYWWDNRFPACAKANGFEYCKFEQCPYKSKEIEVVPKEE